MENPAEVVEHMELDNKEGGQGGNGRRGGGDRGVGACSYSKYQTVPLTTTYKNWHHLLKVGVVLIYKNLYS